ncbi:MAG: flavoprotein [Verrucomicrobiota bacterium]
MMSEKQYQVVIGVTGSIAAYKAAEVTSALVKANCLVDVILTEGGQQFIQPLTFSGLTHRHVVTSLWDENEAGIPSHIELADRADLILVAPATANQLSLMRVGGAPDALNSVLLATKAPILVAPAMNGKMWEHPATQENVEILKSRGVHFIGPDQGLLACGYEGLGKMWPAEQVAETALALLAESGH